MIGKLIEYFFPEIADGAFYEGFPLNERVFLTVGGGFMGVFMMTLGILLVKGKLDNLVKSLYIDSLFNKNRKASYGDHTKTYLRTMGWMQIVFSIIFVLALIIYLAS